MKLQEILAGCLALALAPAIGLAQATPTGENEPTSDYQTPFEGKTVKGEVVSVNPNMVVLTTEKGLMEFELTTETKNRDTLTSGKYVQVWYVDQGQGKRPRLTGINVTTAETVQRPQTRGNQMGAQHDRMMGGQHGQMMGNAQQPTSEVVRVVTVRPDLIVVEGNQGRRELSTSKNTDRALLVPGAVVRVWYVPVATGQQARLERAERASQADMQRFGQARGQGGSQSGARMQSAEQGQASQRTVQVQGEVLRFKNVLDRQAGRENLVAQLKTGDGQRVIVDLGPAQRMKVQKGDRISVTGVPGRVGDRPVLFASNVNVRGQQAQIGRDPGMRSVDAEILKVKQVPVRGQNISNTVVLLKTANGGRVVADLGPSGNLAGVDLNTGQKIEVSGSMKMVGDRMVLVASRLETLNRQVEIPQNPPTTMRTQQQQQQQKQQQRPN